MYNNQEQYLSYSKESVTFEEMMVQKLNYWKSRLLDRMADYHEAVSRLMLDPTAVISTQQGEKPISWVVDMRYQSLLEAKHLFITGEKMLEELTKGNVNIIEKFTNADVFKTAEDWLSINKKVHACTLNAYYRQGQ